MCNTLIVYPNDDIIPVIICIPIIIIFWSLWCYFPPQISTLWSSTPTRRWLNGSRRSEPGLITTSLRRPPMGTRESRSRAGAVPELIRVNQPWPHRVIPRWTVGQQWGHMLPMGTVAMVTTQEGRSGQMMGWVCQTKQWFFIP